MFFFCDLFHWELYESNHWAGMTMKPRLVSSYDEDCMSTPCHSIWSTTHRAREQMQRPLRLSQAFLDLIRIDELPLERKRTRLWRVTNGLPR